MNIRPTKSKPSGVIVYASKHFTCKINNQEIGLVAFLAQSKLFASVVITPADLSDKTFTLNYSLGPVPLSSIDDESTHKLLDKAYNHFLQQQYPQRLQQLYTRKIKNQEFFENL